LASILAKTGEKKGRKKDQERARRNRGGEKQRAFPQKSPCLRAEGEGKRKTEKARWGWEGKKEKTGSVGRNGGKSTGLGVTRGMSPKGENQGGNQASSKPYSRNPEEGSGEVE